MAAWIAILPPWPALAWLLGASLASGLARGFSGFGAALIFVPLASVALGPRGAAPLMLLLDIFAIVSLTPGAWRLADRAEVGWLALGAALGTPIGALVLRYGDPLVLRWGVSLLILALLALVVSRWRLRGLPGRRLTIGVGTAGGVLGGIAMVSGPPVMAYLLGRDLSPQRVRAAFNLYLAAGGVLAGVAYAASGLLTSALLGPWLVAAPGYGLGIWLGTLMFGRANERVFRQACYAMIALAAALSLPAWDGLLH